MKYYYVKDGVLDSEKGECFVVFVLLSSNDTVVFPHIAIDNCVMNINKNGLSSIEIDWHNGKNKYHRSIPEISNDVCLIQSSKPAHQIKEPWASFLPSGKWPVALEAEYAVDKRTSTIKAVTRNRVNVTSH